MRAHRVLPVILVVAGLLLASAGSVQAQQLASLSDCADFAFSTEEDFLSRGPTPPDGNPLISDGDLLSATGQVCLRNRDLLSKWDIGVDLGLDAVDVVDVASGLVVFSTELDDPQGRFKAGDLLATNGTVIPNQALLVLFQVGRDLGLDAVQLIGSDQALIRFFDFAASKPRDFWREGLIGALREYQVDIWFSTEQTERQAATRPILDGYLLSAATGAYVATQLALLDPPIPADIPNRGVDFGLDAFASDRQGQRLSFRFSTEILYRPTPSFSDGDILRLGGAVEVPAGTLTAPFEPKARFLGLDALHVRASGNRVSLPLILKLLRQLGGVQ